MLCFKRIEALVNVLLPPSIRVFFRQARHVHNSLLPACTRKKVLHNVTRNMCAATLLSLASSKAKAVRTTLSTCRSILISNSTDGTKHTYLKSCPLRYRCWHCRCRCTVIPGVFAVILSFFVVSVTVKRWRWRCCWLSLVLLLLSLSSSVSP